MRALTIRLEGFVGVIILVDVLAWVAMLVDIALLLWEDVKAELLVEVDDATTGVEELLVLLEVIKFDMVVVWEVTDANVLIFVEVDVEVLVLVDVEVMVLVEFEVLVEVDVEVLVLVQVEVLVEVGAES